MDLTYLKISQGHNATQWTKTWVGFEILLLFVISTMTGLFNLSSSHQNNIRARFVKYFNKCLEHDNNVVKSIVFICKSNPMSCAGNNYKMLLNAKNELTIEGLSV